MPKYTIEYNVFFRFFFTNFWRKVAFGHLTGTITCGPLCAAPHRARVTSRLRQAITVTQVALCPAVRLMSLYIVHSLI